MSSCDGSARVE